MLNWKCVLINKAVRCRIGVKKRILELPQGLKFVSRTHTSQKRTSPQHVKSISFGFMWAARPTWSLTSIKNPLWKKRKKGHVLCVKPGAEGDKAVYHCSAHRGVFTQAQRRVKDGQLCLHGGSYCVFWLETDSQMPFSPANWFRIHVTLRAVSKCADGEELCEAKNKSGCLASRTFFRADPHFGVNLQNSVYWLRRAHRFRPSLYALFRQWAASNASNARSSLTHFTSNFHRDRSQPTTHCDVYPRVSSVQRVQ